MVEHERIQSANREDEQRNCHPSAESIYPTKKDHKSKQEMVKVLHILLSQVGRPERRTLLTSRVRMLRTEITVVGLELVLAYELEPTTLR